MKETLVKEGNRNTASPTESAVCGSLQREHSGADYSNCRDGQDAAAKSPLESAGEIQGSRPVSMH